MLLRLPPPSENHSTTPATPPTPSLEPPSFTRLSELWLQMLDLLSSTHKMIGNLTTLTTTLPPHLPTSSVNDIYHRIIQQRTTASNHLHDIQNAIDRVVVDMIDALRREMDAVDQEFDSMTDRLMDLERVLGLRPEEGEEDGEGDEVEWLEEEWEGGVWQF